MRKASLFTQALADARVTVAPLEADLERQWLRRLRKMNRIIFRMLVEEHSLTAAAPEWTLPRRSAVQSRIDAYLEGETDRVNLATTYIDKVGATLGIQFDHNDPLTQGVIAAHSGQRITNVSKTWVSDAMANLEGSFDKGLSLRNAARELTTGMNGLSVGRARMIAATELAGVTNGAGLAMASEAQVARYKVWVTAHDNYVRDSHEAQDGDAVELDEVFANGCLYPGDPNGDPSEVINCRCVLDYTDEAPESSGSMGGIEPMLSHDAPDLGWDEGQQRYTEARANYDAKEQAAAGMRGWSRVSTWDKSIVYEKQVEGVKVKVAREALRKSPRAVDESFKVYEDHMRRYWEKMSTAERRALNEVGITGTEANPIVWGEEMAQHIGATGGRGMMTFYKSDFGADDGTFWHEMGHIAGKDAGPVSVAKWRLANIDDARLALERSRSTGYEDIDWEGHSRLTPYEATPTMYAQTNVQEDWAESYRLWRTQDERPLAYGPSRMVEPGKPPSDEYTFRDLWPAKSKVLDEAFPSKEARVALKAEVVSRDQAIVDAWDAEPNFDTLHRIAAEQGMTPPQVRKVLEKAGRSDSLYEAGRTDRVLAAPSLMTKADVTTTDRREFVTNFEQAFKGHPQSAYVNHYSAREIAAKGMIPLLANDGKTGVLIYRHADGAIEATSLFNVSDIPGSGSAMLRRAIDEYGVDYVECFGPRLNVIYGKLGFVDTDVYKFDPAEAPAGWNTARDDSPDYHIMRLHRVGPIHKASTAGEIVEDEAFEKVVKRADDIRKEAEKKGQQPQ